MVHADIEVSCYQCFTADSMFGVCARVLQALLQGPLVDQLQQRLSGLPTEVVQQLCSMMSTLAGSIGQHGQQVCVGQHVADVAGTHGLC